MSGVGDPSAASTPRPTTVAGSFYPAGTGALASTVDELLGATRSAFPLPADLDPAEIVGVLVPHAGLVYSGILAAAAWRAMLAAPAGGGDGSERASKSATLR